MSPDPTRAAAVLPSAGATAQPTAGATALPTAGAAAAAAAAEATGSAPVTEAAPLYPFRGVFVAAESLICAGAVAGTWQLLTDTFTPDVAVLKPLGLRTWRLPGLWLFATAAAPAGAAAWLAWRRSPRAPDAVLSASALLALELGVQIPFLGLNPLQPAVGVPAAALAGLALRARRSGWAAGAGGPTGKDDCAA